MKKNLKKRYSVDFGWRSELIVELKTIAELKIAELKTVVD